MFLDSNYEEIECEIAEASGHEMDHDEESRGITYNSSKFVFQSEEERVDDPGEAPQEGEEPGDPEQQDEVNPCTLCNRTFKTGAVSTCYLLLKICKARGNFAEPEEARNSVSPGAMRGSEI